MPKRWCGLGKNERILLNFEMGENRHGAPQRTMLHLEINSGVKIENELVFLRGARFHLFTVLHRVETDSVGCSIEEEAVARAAILPVCT